MDGLLWGANVKNDGYGDGIRVGGSTYNTGTKAGRVIYDGSGNVLGSDSPDNHHVWRVRRDWDTADLLMDASSFYGASPDDVDLDMISVVRNQYEYDWMNWPAQWGAPYEDLDNNGVYDPYIDIPGYPGSDQTIWLIANDVPNIVDDLGNEIDYIDYAPGLYGSNPIGIEMKITLWAYAFSSDHPLGNIIYKKAEIKYTGLPGSSNEAELESAYLSNWSDTDIGTFTNDYVGCDVDLSFGYAYNGSNYDGVFSDIYNIPPPAMGYDFFQGPPDNMDIDGDGDYEEYLGLTSFTYFGAGSSISDPDLSSYAGSLQFYNLMGGFLPRPEYPAQVPFVNPITGVETKFALDGDPISGSGWIDGIDLPEGDRRLVMSSGPFNMQLGQSVEIVLGAIGGHGNNYLSSVAVSKYNDQYAQYAYDQNFELPSPPVSPEVQVTSMTDQIILDWGSNFEQVESISPAGFEFEGYNIYQLPNQNSSKEQSILIETFDMVNMVQVIFDQVFDPEIGLVINQPVQIGSDSGIQRFFNVSWDYVNDQPLDFGQTYHFAVSAYNYLEDNADSPFKSLESQLIPITVTYGSSQMDYGAYGGEMSSAEHSQGSSSSSVDVTVINPAQLTGDEYEVSFNQQAYWIGADGQWTTSDPNVGRDVSPSYVSGIFQTNPNSETIDIILNVEILSPDYNYASGISLTFPEETVINYAYENGGAAVSMVSDNEVMLGTTNLDGAGYFGGGNVITVNIMKPEGFPLEIPIDYVIYDDGWAQIWCVDNCETCEAYSIGNDCSGNILSEAVNAVGSTVISYITYASQIENHWRLTNLTTGSILLDNQTFLNGSDLYQGASVENSSYFQYNSEAAPTIDGFQVHVNGGYGAPEDAFDRVIIPDEEAAELFGDSYYDVESYMDNGWAENALAINTMGSNSVTNIDTLQRDIEIRFTGEYDENNYIEYIDDNGATVQYIMCEQDDVGNCIGGSYAWLSGARNYDISIHPDPANPGDGTPIRIWVPFEVWDMEHQDGPQQIDIDIYDRIQNANYDGNPDDPGFMYSFNPYNRMYTHFIHTAYQESGDYISGRTGDYNGFLTWNVVWWDTQFNKGDVVLFKYANPIQPGVDSFTFSTTPPMEFGVAKGDVNLDDEVNIADIITFINHLLHSYELETDDQLYAADVNYDLSLNISDLVGMINHILNAPSMLVQSVPSGVTTIGLSEVPTVNENDFIVPIEINTSETIAAFQIQVEYEPEILTPLVPVFHGVSWDNIEVIHHFSEGKVMYLFYSLNGEILDVDNPPSLHFMNVSGERQFSTKVKLVESVFANRGGTSTPIRYGNRTSKTDILPLTFAMHPNYPNPFNPVTNINFDLPKMSNVKIDIYNVLGQNVKTLVDNTMMAGNHYVQWNGKSDANKNLPSGVYLVKFSAGEFNYNQKIMLIK